MRTIFVFLFALITYAAIPALAHDVPGGPYDASPPCQPGGGYSFVISGSLVQASPSSANLERAAISMTGIFDFRSETMAESGPGNTGGRMTGSGTSVILWETGPDAGLQQVIEESFQTSRIFNEGCQGTIFVTVTRPSTGEVFERTLTYAAGDASESLVLQSTTNGNSSTGWAFKRAAN